MPKRTSKPEQDEFEDGEPPEPCYTPEEVVEQERAGGSGGWQGERNGSPSADPPCEFVLSFLSFLSSPIFGRKTRVVMTAIGANSSSQRTGSPPKPRSRATPMPPQLLTRKDKWCADIPNKTDLAFWLSGFLRFWAEKRGAAVRKPDLPIMKELITTRLHPTSART